MDQLSLYDIAYEKYKITKPIRLIELFAGYGSQALALKYLGVPFEHWKICEWAVKSIQAYKDIHFTDIDIELNSKRTKEDMINFLYQKGISNNYNDPMTKEQISKLTETNLKTIIKNIAITHNLVNIQQVKGSDLEITDTDKYDYIMTYSFPCQDLSLAGKGKGMSDTTTRSGMLWEVERILSELEERPQILLMENVPQVHSTDNLKDFNKWKERLEQFGYTNYFQDLIATDYGIPQTRNRTFMVSLLGDYNYSFPKPISLKLKLKDMLENEVDEKYFLSDRAINGLINQMSKDHKPTIINKGYTEAYEGDGVDISGRMQYHRGNVQKGKIQTINTNQDYGVVVLGNYSPSNYEASRIIDSNYSAPTIKENHGTINATQTDDLRIRKLTPKECFRLMGVKDEDYDNVSKNQSASSLYHLAGDSIVVNVLMAIFKEML